MCVCVCVCVLCVCVLCIWAEIFLRCLFHEDLQTYVALSLDIVNSDKNRLLFYIENDKCG